MSSPRRPRRVATAAAITIATLTIVARPVRAFAAVPDPVADSSLPGGTLITQLLGWLKYAAIAAAVAGLLIGGIATGVGHFGSSYGAASAGRKWILGGVGAAMLAGLAHTIAMTVYNAT